ncbi:protein phosphatase [Shewanella baltica]|uniref:phosphatase domain-containing putative toxin n=1 Tax=Shewanella baltica TaxID=62322 RepID=UPI00217DDE86|nr:tyrosine-protein phosphatase [Shewanella baltica]MCS6127129.1 protein phosphatase [Shewanella baltica]MCS6139071.1 protein phosphatase [Shewanella baltica]MCS6145211.1 protein phosphatase [Shewanella baltica]MCS6169741.1 protein phosphatase [Shewanella baltica]MCS6186965.1 protein phosphatase [Shewanella baltica]
MSHPFDILPLESGARLIFTPCPGTKSVPVAEAVTSLKAAGTEVIITLMPLAELQTFGAALLPDICRADGILWLHLPIEDDASPAEEFELAFVKHRAELLTLMQNKATIAIHCRGGSGRTGLMAAILLLLAGGTLAEVITQVQSIRPNALTNVHQRGYIEQITL